MVSSRFLERIDMTLIELFLIGLCAAVGLGALLAENCLEALVIWLLPIGYYAVRRALKMREQRNAEQAKRQEESDRFWAKERELRTKSSDPAEQTAHDRYRARQQAAYDRHRAAQLQQMNMMHQNATQTAAAQQQAAMNARVGGWPDPRTSYGSDLADNIVNLWAINSMLQSGTGVTRTSYDENTSSVKVQHVPTEQVYRSPDPEPSSSSSSSYSSDTSSDSFGGSDTSSDSF